MLAMFVLVGVVMMPMTSYAGKIGFVNVTQLFNEYARAKGIDKMIEDNNIKIVVDKKSVLYLVGTELDFTDGLNGKGFSFINPNASRTCGCGESFSI